MDLKKASLDIPYLHHKYLMKYEAQQMVVYMISPESINANISINSETGEVTIQSMNIFYPLPGHSLPI